MRETPPARTTVYRSHFLREMAPPGRGCVVWTFGLVSVPSYPRHLSRSLSHAPATHVNGRAAGLRPPPLFSTITPTLNFHAIRSAVRLPRASQPCSCPWAGTPSDRARCLTASRLSARGHGRAEVATVFSAAATERRESREARTHSSSPLTPTTLAWIPPSLRYLPLSFQASPTYSKRAH